MSDPRGTTEFFDLLGKVLLRCWLFGFLLLFVWLGVYFIARQFVHVVHGGMFGLSDHELDAIFYCGIGLFKLVVLLLFFFSWLAVRLVLGREKKTIATNIRY